MPKYISFPAYHDSAPLDISYVFAEEKPAGKHGFLQAKGDNFYFEDGTLARFWGTNLNAGSCFPDKEYAPKLAKRIAAYGCNIVRLHQVDSEFTTPNIYQMTKGQRLETTRKLCDESLERMDYLIYCLREQGIYVYMDNLTFRKFKQADGVENSLSLTDRAAPYCLFNRKLIELQKEYMEQIWNHENPYLGGQKYKDNPQIVLTDVCNEVDLFGCFNQRIVVEPYDTEFREMYRAWCRENAPDEDVDGADLNSLANETLNAFKYKVCEDYYNEMFDYLHRLGVKIPMCGINYSWRDHQRKAAQRIGDFADSHLNIRYVRWNPDEKFSRNVGLHEQPDWGTIRSVARRHFGKPFFHSEWDLTFPNKYRTESAIVYAATGLLQNWSGYTIHTYAYTNFLPHMKILGKELNAVAIGNTGYREGIFATWNDPAKFGMFYHASLMTRRGDVKPGNQKITIGVKDLEIPAEGKKPVKDLSKIGTEPVSGLKLSGKKAFLAAAEYTQVGADYWGDYENTADEYTPIVDLSKGEVKSDTGELYRSWEKKYGVVDTPMTKAVYGRLSQNGTISLQDMTVKCSNDYAVIALSSLNNKLDIAHSDSMLLTTVGDATNTDMKWEEGIQPEDGYGRYMEMKDFGKPPIVCEVIEAEIAIRTDRKDLVIWSIGPEATFVGRVPTKYENGYLKFTLGNIKNASIYYLIQAE